MKPVAMKKDLGHRVRDLEAQLEYTHTHYQKLLEQVKPRQLLTRCMRVSSGPD